MEPTQGDGTNGGKSMDSGLDDRGGEWLFQAVFCESGESGQMVDEGGVTGIQSGASGERDVAEDFVFTGIERLEDKARHREIQVVCFFEETRTYLEKQFERALREEMIVAWKQNDSSPLPKRPAFTEQRSDQWRIRRSHY